MSFAWSDVGAAPAADEVEVTVFGPGFGECIVVHLGSGQWIVVDSCIDISDQLSTAPVAERYLRALGVDLAIGVRLIVATHWHDDHVRGLARLVEICPQSIFSCANALMAGEFLEYVEAMRTAGMTTDGAKLREYARVFQLLRRRGHPVPRMATGSKTLLRLDGALLAHGHSATVTALSPSDREYDLFLQRIAAMIPVHGRPSRAAPRSGPNLASVVLSVAIGDLHLCLAADMELHSDPQRGWSAVFEEAMTSQVGRATLVKVAHHGSANGHHDEFWKTHIAARPQCVVTPFNRSTKLPREEDVARLKALGDLYITGPTSLRKSAPKDAAVERTLRESGIQMRDLRTPLGMVRLRRTQTEQTWRSEVFAPACHFARSEGAAAPA